MKLITAILMVIVLAFVVLTLSLLPAKGQVEPKGVEACQRPFLSCRREGTPIDLRCDTWEKYAKCLESGGCREGTK